MYEVACEGFPETFPLTAARSTIASHDITAVNAGGADTVSPGR